MVICTLSTKWLFHSGSRNALAKRKCIRLWTGVLAEVVVDAEDRALREGLVQDAVELLRGAEVASEGLLQHHAAAFGAAGAREPADHEGECARRDRQVEGGVLRRAERGADRREGGGLCVVAAHVEQALRQLLEGGRVHPTAVLLDALPRARVDAVDVDRLAADRHHGRVEAPAFHHGVQRREDLLEGEVAGRPEDHQRVGVEAGHGSPNLQTPFGGSRCPPNSERSAESRRPANASAPREAKR